MNNKLEMLQQIKMADEAVEWIDDEGNLKERFSKEDIEKLVFLIGNEAGLLPAVYIPMMSALYSQVGVNNVKEVVDFLYKNQLYTKMLAIALLYSSSSNAEQLRNDVKEFVKRDMLLQEIGHIDGLKLGHTLVDKNEDDFKEVSKEEFIEVLRNQIRNNEFKMLMVGEGGKIGVELNGERIVTFNAIKDVIKLVEDEVKDEKLRNTVLQILKQI